MRPNKSKDPQPAALEAKLKVLNAATILEVDRALEKIGSFGEVRLVKKTGQVRFIESVESLSVVENEAPLE